MEMDTRGKDTVFPKTLLPVQGPTSTGDLTNMERREFEPHVRHPDALDLPWRDMFPEHPASKTNETYFLETPEIVGN